MTIDAILAIDPGPEHSGVVALWPRGGSCLGRPQVLGCGDMPNEQIRQLLRKGAASGADFPRSMHLRVRMMWGTVAIEEFRAHGMGHGIAQESIETVLQTGRFYEAARNGMVEQKRAAIRAERGGEPGDWPSWDIRLIPRPAVLRHFGISPRKKSKDSLLIDECCKVYVDHSPAHLWQSPITKGQRAALRRSAKGVKAAPGPLYGMAGHSWQAFALALAVEAADMGAYL